VQLAVAHLVPLLVSGSVAQEYSASARTAAGRIGLART
jgi:hypothetical protein